jgi:hypothetical protein
MTKIEPVSMEDVEKWMEINTFVCRFGRVSPEQCEKLRARPTLKEWIEGKVKGENLKFKPRVCEECYEWELLCQMVYEKREKFYEELKKQEKEGREMAEKKSKNTKAKRGPLVQINFAKYPELYQKLKEMAKEECREVSQQILFCVKMYIETISKARRTVDLLEKETSEFLKKLKEERGWGIQEDGAEDAGGLKPAPTQFVINDKKNG